MFKCVYVCLCCTICLWLFLFSMFWSFSIYGHCVFDAFALLLVVGFIYLNMCVCVCIYIIENSIARNSRKNVMKNIYARHGKGVQFFCFGNFFEKRMKFKNDRFKMDNEQQKFEKKKLKNAVSK